MSKVEPQDVPSTDAPKEEGPRSFSRFVATVADGEAERQLSSELFELGRRLQEQVKAQGRKVTGTLKFGLKFNAETNGTVTVTYGIDVTTPKPITTPALFWLTRNGNLSAQDTRQMELRPREVPAPKREIREVSSPPGQPKEV